MIYLQLFWSFFQIGMFSIGGGYAAMPLIQNQVVDLHGWLTLTEFSDIITIAEMTPGPIAINSATFVGIQVAGIPGALISTLGCVTPSCIIVLTLAYFYFKYKEMKSVQAVLNGLRPAVIAMIASAGLSIALLSFFGDNKLPSELSDVNFVSIAIFLVALFVLRRFKLNPIAIIMGSGGVGLIVYLAMPFLQKAA